MGSARPRAAQLGRLESVLVHAIVGLTLLTLNIYATARVARSGSYTRLQTMLQIVLVWVLPLLGAGSVILVSMSDRSNPVARPGSDASDIHPYAAARGFADTSSAYDGSGHGGDDGHGAN